MNIRGNIAPNVSWGLMSGKPSKLRIYAGPCSICPKHPWDAMILRDAATSTSGIGDIESIASRKFDILLIKMCEEYDRESPLDRVPQITFCFLKANLDCWCDPPIQTPGSSLPSRTLASVSKRPAAWVSELGRCAADNTSILFALQH